MNSSKMYNNILKIIFKIYKIMFVKTGYKGVKINGCIK